MVKVIHNGELAEVDDDLFGIVSEIKRLWPNLTVQFLDPDRAGLSDPPYRIVEHTINGPVQVMALWSLDSTVLDKLHMSNSQRVDIEALVDKENAKVKAAEKAKTEEDNAQGADIAASIMNHFNHGKLEFNYTNEHGEKRVVREDGFAGPKKIEVI